MAQMVFVVRSVAVEPNERGIEMRRVRCLAIGGEAFAPTGLAEGVAPAPPVGGLDVLVNPAFAKPLQVGDEITVVIKERE